MNPPWSYPTTKTVFNPTRMQSPLLHLALILFLMLLSACAHHSSSSYTGRAPKPEKSYTKLSIPPETGDDIQHSVYIFGDGNLSKPPVLLLHELPGLSQQTIEYADFLSEDFTVYVPLLFGEFGGSSFTKGVIEYAFNGEWNAWSGKDEKRPIVTWLGSVLDQIHDKHQKQPVGIIGMCLTGALPLALLDKLYVKAVVVAQPTLPFIGSDDDLGISPSELRTAIDRASKDGVKVYALRFRHDLISKRDKYHFLMKKFGASFKTDGEIKDSEYSYSDEVEPVFKNSHSTLTFSGIPPESHPVNVKRTAVSKFLRNELSGHYQASKH